MHNEKLNVLYFVSDIIRVIKFRKMEQNKCTRL